MTPPSASSQETDSQPTVPEASSTPERRFCGLGNHRLRLPYKRVTDPGMLRFAQKVNPMLRTTTPICNICFETLEKIYKVKLNHAVAHEKRKREEDSSSSSFSDVSSSQKQQPPKNISSSASSTSKTGSTSEQSAKVSSLRVSRLRAALPDDSDSTTISDDDQPVAGINVRNGTRLPNIQPAPKRRQFVNLNKDIMDIYLAGTTGG